MDSLSKTGKYTVSEKIMEQISENFCAGCADDIQTSQTIKTEYDKRGYLFDTHTAVAAKVYLDYLEKTGDKTPTVIAATASPYKFAKSVLSALMSKTPDLDDFSMTEKLSELTHTEIPKPLSNLRGREVRFSEISKVSDMEQCVYNLLGI